MSHPVSSSPRSSGLCRGVAVVVVTLVAAGAGDAPAAPAQAAGPRIRAVAPQVLLLGNHVARTRPGARTRRIKTVAARRPLTHVRTVLPTIGAPVIRGGRGWVRVRLPGRPNGRTGWISTDRTRGLATRWHITVRLASRRVAVYRDGRVVRRYRAVVGHPSTPTPRGRFFVEEAVALAPKDSGGPFALATSARSEVLQEFNGGPGQIALHGTHHLPDPLGTAASHGCIRLSPRAITWLIKRIGRGVPVTVST